MTLIVNLYGGPGVGKSTMAAAIFAQLKQAGHSAELVTEFAKDLAWENRAVIKCRPYVFGEQLWRIERLLGLVDVVVTDSPLFMDIVYSRHYGAHWLSFVEQEHGKLNNLEVLLTRNQNVHPYDAEGRFQTLEQAREIDQDIKTLLDDKRIDYMVADVSPGAVNILVERVQEELDMLAEKARLTDFVAQCKEHEAIFAVPDDLED